MGEFGKPHARTGQVPPQLLNPAFTFLLWNKNLEIKKKKEKGARAFLPETHFQSSL